MSASPNPLCPPNGRTLPYGTSHIFLKMSPRVLAPPQRKYTRCCSVFINYTGAFSFKKFLGFMSSFTDPVRLECRSHLGEYTAKRAPTGFGYPKAE